MSESLRSRKLTYSMCPASQSTLRTALELVKKPSIISRTAADSCLLTAATTSWTIRLKKTSYRIISRFRHK